MNQEKVTNEVVEEVKDEKVVVECMDEAEKLKESEGGSNPVDKLKNHVHELAEITELDDRIREICPDIENILYKNVNNAIEGTVLKDKKMVRKGIGFLSALEEINVIAKGTTKAFKKSIKEDAKTDESCVRVIVGPGKTEEEYKKSVEVQIRKQLAGKMPQEAIDSAVFEVTEEGWKAYKKRNHNK